MSGEYHHVVHVISIVALSNWQAVFTAAITVPLIPKEVSAEEEGIARVVEKYLDVVPEDFGDVEKLMISILTVCLCGDPYYRKICIFDFKSKIADFASTNVCKTSFLKFFSLKSC